MNTADRKKQLIAQGRVHRAEVVVAKEEVRSGMRPHSMASAALNQVALIALAAFRNRVSGAGINLAALLPLAASGVSALSKKKAVLKPVLRGVLVAGTLAAAVALVTKKKKQQQQPPLAALLCMLVQHAGCCSVVGDGGASRAAAEVDRRQNGLLPQRGR